MSKKPAPPLIPIAGSPEYLAVDASDTLYVWHLRGSKGSGIMEFAPGATTGKDLGLDTTGIGALQVDSSGKSSLSTISV